MIELLTVKLPVIVPPDLGKAALAVFWALDALVTAVLAVPWALLAAVEAELAALAAAAASVTPVDPLS